MALDQMGWGFGAGKITLLHQKVPSGLFLVDRRCIGGSKMSRPLPPSFGTPGGPMTLDMTFILLWKENYKLKYSSWAKSINSTRA